MSKRYQCAVAAAIGSIVALTTASFSWWAGAPVPPANAIKSGAIILDGTKEVPGPFQLAIQDDRVLINGQTILELAPPVPPIAHDLDTRHGVISNALEQYALIQGAQGRQIASTDTLAMLRTSDLVESARALGPDSIEVLFKNTPYPDILELSGERRGPLGPQGRRQLLVDHQLMIEGFLRADRLVILIDGIVTATEPGTAKARLAILQEAATAELTRVQRLQMLQPAIGDNLVASLVADRMIADSGKVVQP
ncbi:MAG: hypothetical protein VX527_09375 [Planctomycetota bacterium]|nr:hypothetical protein [Planctomycetota bacterium]